MAPHQSHVLQFGSPSFDFEMEPSINIVARRWTLMTDNGAFGAFRNRFVKLMRRRHQGVISIAPFRANQCDGHTKSTSSCLVITGRKRLVLRQVHSLKQRLETRIAAVGLEKRFVGNKGKPGSRRTPILG